ncbi:MAG: DsbA family protein [Terriglobales bacterium]
MKRNRLWLLGLLVPLALASLVAVRAHAQDASVLKPPKGARVALVVFEDLQCPDCARANPLLEQAARTYNIPIVRYDFPLPMHPWAQQAAVLARYFDTLSAAPKSRRVSANAHSASTLGDEFRDAIFRHQREITPQNLHAFAEKFAAEHKVALPFVIDPQGKLAAEVEADRELGKRVGISHTPTIYVVSNARAGTPFVEVVDRRQLFQLIEAVQKEAQ